MHPFLNAQPGSLDGKFGENGKVFIPYKGGLVRRAIQLNNGNTLHQSYNLMIEIKNDGNVDSSFGNKGIVKFEQENEFYAYSLTQQEDGKIIVGGNDFDGKVVLYRCNSNGDLDHEFGKSGKVITKLNGVGSAYALATQPDGRIVVSGFYSEFFNSEIFPMVIRYNSDSTLDKDFGNKDTLSIPVYGTIGYAVTIQENGKIIVGGGSYNGKTVTIY